MIKQVNLNEKDIELIVEALIARQSIIYRKGIYKRLIDKIQTPHKRIKVSSAKAKGRNLQKWAVQKIAELLKYKLPENKDDSHIRSREMGQSGIDVVLSKKAKQKFPFAIECKNQEKINLPEFMKQAKANGTEDIWPLLIVKNKTLKEPLLIMEWETFENLYHGQNIFKDVPLD
jgi:hypothetical protein